MLIAHGVSSLFVNRIMTAPQLGASYTIVRRAVEVKDSQTRAIARAKYDVTDSVHLDQAIVGLQDVSAG